MKIGLARVALVSYTLQTYHIPISMRRNVSNLLAIIVAPCCTQAATPSLLWPSAVSSSSTSSVDPGRACPFLKYRVVGGVRRWDA